jgi:hypothetical protein
MLHSVATTNFEHNGMSGTSLSRLSRRHVTEFKKNQQRSSAVVEKKPENIHQS